MLYGNRPNDCVTSQRDEIAVFGFDLECLTTSQGKGHRERLTSLVDAEFDFRKQICRHLAMDVALSVKKDGVLAATTDEAGEFRVSNHDSGAVREADDNRSGRSGRLKQQNQKEI